MWPVGVGWWQLCVPSPRVDVSILVVSLLLLGGQDDGALGAAGGLGQEFEGLVSACAGNGGIF